MNSNQKKRKPFKSGTLALRIHDLRREMENNPRYILPYKDGYIRALHDVVLVLATLFGNERFPEMAGFPPEKEDA